MIEKIVKHIPSSLKENKIFNIYRRSYGAFQYYVEPLFKEYFFYIRYGYKLKKFKDIHKGRRCFIIGNGPSILQQDLSKLKDEITFVTNQFVLHEDYEKINPKYYCHAETINWIHCNPNSELHRLINEKTKHAVNFFLIDSKPFVEKYNFFPGHQIFYLFDFWWSHRIWEKGSMRLDITKALYTAETVIIDFCLPLAFYMGFSEIYLLGCDCDYRVDEAPDLSKAYFYDQAHLSVEERRPAEYFKGWTSNTIKCYSIAKETFERHDRKIYNAGIGGKLEVFERVNYDELF